ncbi:S41 family peptidase [Streptomyces bohaiensis]|uniref:PDZ domain-containing protein n=1 Tax=Streptomyces bohaiensis TaxID=1431344 RepID=A0ABX1CCA1_9ACTN|nr:S41 family peptidase [Streptomyces bohaiensis]NJQ16731.1 PDZ domain-containing protein [Streptomyces bohaiensis]
MSRLERLYPRPGLRRSVLAGACAGLLAAGAWSGPWGVGTGHAEPGPSPDAARLVEGAGDHWSSAFTAEEYEAFRQSLDGEYVGTGMAVRRTQDGRTVVSEVRSGSPAQRAGVRSGDLLRSVDGASVDDRPVTEVVGRLRGSGGPAPAGAGSAVLVGVERDGRSFEERLFRELLAVEPVTVRRVEEGVTEVRVAAFVQGAAEQVRSAVAAAPAGDGIVLDLRGNAGGLIEEAAETASVFLDGGVVATYDVHGRERALHARTGGDTDRPLVVLVDGGTMSSAELLAGALRDRMRAVVVGRPTFGKGTVQMPVEQPDGSVAELTVGTYATPSGARVADGRGIEPDLVPAPGDSPDATARSVLRGLAAGDG